MTTASQPRRRKGKPFNPAHDRMATDLLRGAVVAPVEVDDPYEEGAKIIVMRSIRDDALASMRAREQIDEAQFQAGRAFQNDWERAERGPCAIDFTKEAVDGGCMPEPFTEGQRKAVLRLNRAERELGADGSAIVYDALITGLTAAKIGERRGLVSKRWQDYFARRLKECLDRLALIYGFTNA